MSPSINRQWILKSRPVGMPTAENFQLIESKIPQPGPGQVLVRTLYLSVDPYIRGRMKNVRSYVPPLELNEVIDGGVVGHVVESKHPGFKPGDFVRDRLGWQDYALSDGKNLEKLELEPALLPQALGALGMPGYTAYFALLEIGRPKAGETVAISAAAGAVGSIAGQIAKILGCHTVGIVGSDEKVRIAREEFQYDEAVNYKSHENLRHALKPLCPRGIDVYFDNVGGPISDAVMTLINLRARIIICGQISIANRERPEMGPRNLLYLLINRARMEGFLVHDHAERFHEAHRQLLAWIRDGHVKYRQTLVEGLERAPDAFIGLFTGQNIGKQLVKVAQ